MDPEITDILEYVLSRGTGQADHADYVSTFKMACVNRKWLHIVTEMRSDIHWNAQFLASAAIFASNIYFLYLTKDHIHLVKGLSNYMVLKNPIMQLHGITALYIMTTTNNAQENRRAIRRMVRAKGMHVVVGAMIMSPGHLQLHVVCFRMIAQFCDYRKQGPMTIWSHAQCSVVVKQILLTMRKFTHALDIQTTGVQSLLRLCMYHAQNHNVNGGANICRREVLNNSGMATALAAIYAHEDLALHNDLCELMLLFPPESTDMLLHALSVNTQQHNGNNIVKILQCLATLLGNHAYATHFVLGVPNGVHELIQVYTTCHTYHLRPSALHGTTSVEIVAFNAKVQCAVCQCLEHIAFVSGLVERVVEEGGVELLVGAIGNTTNPVTRRVACGCLDHIAWIDSAERMLIHKAGGLEAVRNMFVAHHHTDMRSMSCGCELLVVLVKIPVYRTLMCDMDMVSAVQILKNNNVKERLIWDLTVQDR